MSDENAALSAEVGVRGGTISHVTLWADAVLGGRGRGTRRSVTLSVVEPLAASWFYERWRCYSMRPDECICQPMESMILGPKPGIPVLRDGSNCRMLYEDDRPVALLHLLRNDGPDEGTCIVEYRSRCWDYLSTATRTEPPRWPRMSATNPRTITLLPPRLG